MRILVSGWPRAGKTTLANRIGVERGLLIRHTDDLIPLGWSPASLEVSVWMENPGPWCIEGVTIPRSLRKWLDRNPEGTPADVVYWSATPREELTTRQIGMGKGTEKVWNEIRDELVRRGMRVEQF